MTDVSPRRRMAGRLLLAATVLALPLTASISYASAQEQPLPPAEVPPSDAPPAPPASPAPPAAVAPDSPDEPAALAARRPERRVQRFVLHHDDNVGGADSGKVERHRFVFETDGPLTPEQQKRFQEMGKQWEKKAAEWQKMAKHREAFALAMRDKIPEVSSDCAQTNGSASRLWTDKDGRQHVVICERVILDEAQMGQRMARQAQGHAMMSLRQARETIASNDELSDSVKREVLVDLDREIARLQADH